MLGPLCVGSPPRQNRRTQTGGNGGLCAWGHPRTESAGEPGEEGARAEPTGPPSESWAGSPQALVSSVSTAEKLSGKWALLAQPGGGLC